MALSIIDSAFIKLLWLLFTFITVFSDSG